MADAPTGVLFRSDRQFKVWQYSVGHRRLLLRSPRARPLATRIEVYFACVGLMLLRPAYHGLAVRRATDEESRTVIGDHGIELEEGAYVFALGENLSSGFVVSAPPQWHEDEGGVDDPSWFGHMVGTR
ncbi:hypothetical protein ACH4MM_12680 [Streptomyces pratensis]|uniref:hypothetical protein n=1 Tax=Streptomyces pratensis TaxID=1169025 RepID=UPI0037A7CB94